jgi:histidyl-tRNA synthetase
MLRDAADFVMELTRLSGRPADVMGPLRLLVESRGLATKPLDELEQVVSLLQATGFNPDDIEIDLGMGRGLHYYTGMLFEIYAGDATGPQLCGGGRYDDLAQVLGARAAVPACGFSFGLERVLSASESVDVPEELPAVLILQHGDPAAAIVLADDFRRAGWAAALDLRGRNESATRRSAIRQGYLALASAVDGGVEVVALHGSERRLYATAPAPDEVVTQ